MRRSTKSSRMVHSVYVLRCVDGTFYVGSAQDFEARVKAHTETPHTRSNAVPSTPLILKPLIPSSPR
jgi:hypothetical protein